MQIEYRTGDMLASDIVYQVQGVNAQGVMGSGIARTIRDRYPNVYAEYRRVYETQGNKLHLGQMIWVDCGEHTIGNLVSQQTYGRDADRGAVYVSYDAIQQGVDKIDAYMEGRQSVVRALFDLEDPDRTPEAIELEPVAFPLIGAGLAGGSWKIISAILESNSIHFKPVVYLLDGKIPVG